MTVVGAVVLPPGEGWDLLPGRLVDPACRRSSAVAVDEPGRALLAEPALETPDRRPASPSNSAASVTLSSPATTFVVARARRCSTVVIVIVSLMPGD